MNRSTDNQERRSALGSAFVRLAGAGLARLREHMLTGPYAMLSAHRGLSETEAERAENNRRQRELKRVLRERGFGWVDTRGAWSEPLPQGGRQWVNENSVFIPGISAGQARDIARLFDQQAVLLGQGGRYQVQGLEDEAAPPFLEGDVDRHLRLLQPDDEADLYSAVRGKRWVLDPDQTAAASAREAARDGSRRVFYVCSDPLPMLPLSGVLPLAQAQVLPAGALSAYVPIPGSGRTLRTASGGAE